MEKYKIEKGIKAPSPRTGKPMFPFRKMEVDDSFLVPTGEDKYMSYHAWAAGEKRENGKKFVCRKEPGGTRVFRFR